MPRGKDAATRTRLLVDRGHGGEPSLRGGFTARKLVPGSRPWALQAVLDGGGMPHRLGLSETVLLFDQHQAFFPRPGDPVAFLVRERHRVCEKKVLVGVSSLDEARAFADPGGDGLQFDKVAPGDLASWGHALRSGGDRGTLIATGGVNGDTVAAYAAYAASGTNLDVGTSLGTIDNLV